MSKKKIALIILAVISVASIVFIIVSTQKKTNNKTGIKEPVLEQKYAGKYSISLSIDENQTNLPKELPILEANYTGSILTQEQATKIASNLGFLGDPTTIDDAIDGTTYFWKKDSLILFAYAKSGKMRYETGEFTPGVNKQLSDAEILDYAQQFITKTAIFTGSDFQLGKIKYLKMIPNGEGFQETDKQNAVLFQIGILPKTTSYEFISTVSVDPTSFIQLKQDGSVYMLQVTPFPGVKEGTVKYKLKTYKEVSGLLNEAVLIELRGNAQLLSDMPSNLIENIKITDIKVAYLVESPNSTYYQPVYKLTGEATLSNSPDKYIATLYLPAISK